MPGRHLRTELRLTYAALALTLSLTGLALTPVVGLLARHAADGRIWAAAEVVLFLILVLILIYGGVVYQLARVGHLKRLWAHRPVDDGDVERMLWSDGASPPPVAILVPSYKEEAPTIEQTLISAALQTYPGQQVVLLLDDPPSPADPDDRLKLTAAKEVLRRLRAKLGELGAPLSAAHTLFEARVRGEGFEPVREAKELAHLYIGAAEALERWATLYGTAEADHTDRFFLERVLKAPAYAHRERAERLRREGVDQARASLEFRRLASLFEADVHVFERKRYLNLSHEPNKAMNLNSYIGLLGRSFEEVVTPEGTLLREVDALLKSPDLSVPVAEYIITLDADSLLMPHYAERLVHHLEEHPRAAVVQTPYTAVPGAPGRLERVAGATTDIQYLVHQGSAYFSAAYWVGANAVLRRTALDHICSEVTERGYEIRRYIQDRTVIEDTESTLDLIERSWEIHNHLERLAYSATPPDFGAVLVQRHRWANGGLIILPKLLRYLLRAPSWSRVAEGFLRVHYLFSLAGVNLALLLVFVYPFDRSVGNLWLPLTAVPYFLLYGHDLALIGRRRRDLLPVYAFNLMLIPVQLGGVLASLRQALTRRKSSFGRTPKVAERTAAPKRYVVAELGLLTALSVGAVVDALAGNTLQAVLSVVNAGFFAYVVTAFIGWRACVEDLLGWRPTGPQAPSRERRPSETPREDRLGPGHVRARG